MMPFGARPPPRPTGSKPMMPRNNNTSPSPQNINQTSTNPTYRPSQPVSNNNNNTPRPPQYTNQSTNHSPVAQNPPIPYSNNNQPIYTSQNGPPIVDGRGRGGPPPSRPAYGGPPSNTNPSPINTNNNGSRQPNQGPPLPGNNATTTTTNNNNNNNNQPPTTTTTTFHNGQGRYPPTNTTTSSTTKSPTTTSRPRKSSVNRPPDSLTKPRTSKPRKNSKDSRIDPRQIPRPSLPSKQNTVDAIYATRTGKGLPPEDCGDYLVEDQGNTSPRMLRMTTNSIPRSKDMLVASKIPFRAHVRPFAPKLEQDSEIPVLDFGQEGPPRCARCNGFINPYVKFEDDGKTWRCNLCNVMNEVENPSYVCNLDAYGRRYDLGKYSKRRRSNVAVIHVRVVFIGSFLFYCLLLNHSFPTNPNRMTNSLKLFSLYYNFTNYICSMRSRYFDF